MAHFELARRVLHAACQPNPTSLDTHWRRAKRHQRASHNHPPRDHRSTHSTAHLRTARAAPCGRVRVGVAPAHLPKSLAPYPR